MPRKKTKTGGGGTGSRSGGGKKKSSGVKQTTKAHNCEEHKRHIQKEKSNQ